MWAAIWRRIGASSAALLCAGVVLPGGGCATTTPDRHLEQLGLTYRLREIPAPRPNRAHILRLDMANGRIDPAVVVAADPDGLGPAEAALTDPRELAADPAVRAFVNTNPWDSFPDNSGAKNRRWYAGQPVDIHGLAAAAGQTRSPADPNRNCVWFNADGRVFIADRAPDGSVTEGMAGFQQILRGGALLVEPGGAVHPRTAIGANRDGTIVWLVVVDGRQAGYSEGMNLHELAGLMRDLGCWDAANMDGGGSSVMGVAGADGRVGVINSPSDRRAGLVKVRPLPMVLTIREKTR